MKKKSLTKKWTRYILNVRSILTGEVPNRKEVQMAKVTFENLGTREETMVHEFELIGKKHVTPIGALFEKFSRQGYRHGMKQRAGDFGALPKDMPEREKEKVHLERLQAWTQHLASSTEWRMPKGEVDTSAAVIEAMNRIDPKKYPVEKLQKALEIKPEQLKTWRSNAKVQAMIATIRAEKLKKVAKESSEEVEVEIE